MSSSVSPKSSVATETGYAFGFRFEHPLGEGWPLVRLRGGGTYDHIELEDDDGDIVADTGHGLGWEVGAGLVVPLGDRWALTPTARYRALSRDLELETGSAEVDLNVIRLGMGLAYSF